jgi:hypothetical protein
VVHKVGLFSTVTGRKLKKMLGLSEDLNSILESSTHRPPVLSKGWLLECHLEEADTIQCLAKPASPQTELQQSVRHTAGRDYDTPPA